MSPRFRYILFLCFLSLIIVGCQPAASQAQTIQQAPLPYILVTQASDATITATPFQPDPSTRPTTTGTPLPPTATLSPTPTLSPTATTTPFTPTSTPRPTSENLITATPNFQGDVWEDYPPPLYYPISTQIPLPVGMLSQEKGQVNILLLGSDIRPDSSAFRTDTIILLTVNKNMGTVNLTSFPRDMYVYIPGWTMQRINTAMARGGYETLGMTMAYNFGVYPDHYVMVNFSNFVEIINSLGGIDVEVSQSFSDQRTGYGWFFVPEGTFHMDGDTALWYVRSRYTTSDIDRLRRAQEVIQAIGYRMLSFEVLTHAPELYELYQESVFTDLTLGNIVSLLPAATTLVDTDQINRYVIGYGPVYDWIEPYTGAMVLLPNRYLVRQIMREALNVP
ncbi:MAG: hypothetical protein B5M51_02050 [Anaerolinea sp. 4484_236]|nr:MAG: hypothetical protein B5M51_02050 [Anaerolinea sp. 4484_236]